jgi:hypothetical protein
VENVRFLAGARGCSPRWSGTPAGAAATARVMSPRTLARLRRTGMPTREMREFTRLVTEGATTHGQRLARLAAHRDRIVARLAELQDDLAVLEEEVEHYRYLIEQAWIATP